MEIVPTSDTGVHYMGWGGGEHHLRGPFSLNNLS